MKWVWIWFAVTAFAQDINLLQIMDDPHWIGALPQSVSIDHNEENVYFNVSQPIPHNSVLKRLNLTDGQISDVGAEHWAAGRTGAIFHHKDTAIHVTGGDIWVQRPGQKLTPLLQRPSRLRFVRFLDEETFVFRESNQLYSFHLPSGQTLQLTNLVLGDDEEESKTWYTREEQNMLKFVEELHQRKALREENQAQSRQGYRQPHQVHLGKNYDFGSTFLPSEDRYMLDISPDKAYTVVSLEPDEEGKPTEYAEFINTDAAVKAKKARPKVGHTTPTWKLGLIDNKSGELRWVDVSDLPNVKTDPLAAIKKDLSEADREFLPAETKDEVRPVMFIPGGFNADGSALLVTAFSRDYKNRWIFLVSCKDLSIQLVDHQFDEAWITFFLRGLTTNRNASGAAFWRRDKQRVMFLSDKSGYHHLYSYDPSKDESLALTHGQFEVYHPYESANGRRWYFHANKVHPGEIHFYSMPIDGGPWTQYTEEAGHHQVTVSPSGKMMVALFSTATRPPVLRIRRGVEPWKVVYDGTSQKFKDINWATPTYVAYKNRDGKKVHARLYKPERPNGAAVIFVHGAGYLQNAHKGWSGYYREYMFHNLLLREGFTILDPDYQASAGYGRDWRTAIYRHMGGKDLNDIVDGAEYLVDDHGIDAKRLGVYGGSYGGFITLMALFTTPDVFLAGAALRPVTDWAYYNNWYTSRILNTPQSDPEAYRRSSPIYFAEGLKGHLLIAHGMVDDNVQYQDSVRLAQKLIELRKKNWELSSYPVEPHGFKTPSGWYDEYRRIHELFQRTLLP